MNLPKVLIGCPTNQRKDYSIPSYLDNVTRLTYNNKVFYFSDNSYDDKFHVARFHNKGFDCGYISPKNKKDNQFICESFNQIREHFLNSDCEYWLSLECDLFPPKNIIEELLSYQSPIVSARYMIGEGERSFLLSMVYDDTFGENVNILFPKIGSYYEYGTSQCSTGNYGLGCMLIHRSIMEQMAFWIGDDTTHTDTFFNLDLNYLGIEVTRHEQLIEHQNINWQWKN